MQPKGLLKFLRLEGFAQNVTEYVENRIAIAKLEAKQKIADVVSTLAAVIPAALFGLFALIFLSLTLAQAFNVWLDSRVWGFLIVGVLYLVIAFVLFSQRDADWLKKKIVDGSTKFLKDKPEQQDKDNATAEGYHADHVEHKKVIFEDAEEDHEPVAKPVRDRESVVTATQDREPVSNAEIAEAAKSPNATIIVHSETDDDTIETDERRS